MTSPMLTQSDVANALSDFNAKVVAANAAITAMYTIELPAGSYATVSGESSTIQAAGNARDAIAALFVTANDQAAAVAALITPLLPLS